MAGRKKKGPAVKAPATPKKKAARVAPRAPTTKKKPAAKAAPQPKAKTKAKTKAVAKKTPAKAVAKAPAKAVAKTPAKAVAKSPKREPVPRAPESAALIPSPAPSERLLAARADVPKERSLTDEEREAMSKVSETARRFVDAEGSPQQIVVSIATYVEDVRRGVKEEPQSQDIRLGLGVLWGEQLRAQVGWRWVHLTYADGFASYALVPDDRAFACFPLNRVPEALKSNATNTAAHVFDSIKAGTLPTRYPNAYLVIG